jgi:hypothetical protein
MGTLRTHGKLYRNSSERAWLHGNVGELCGYLDVTHGHSQQPCEFPPARHLCQGRLLSAELFAMGATLPHCASGFTLRFLTGWLLSRNALYLGSPPLQIHLQQGRTRISLQLQGIHMQLQPMYPLPRRGTTMTWVGFEATLQ